ncbi:MAG: glycosyltransferase [Candidatus Helarchaeota archaeon]
MKISKVIFYGSIVATYFIVLHIFFPPWLNSPIKQGIDSLFTNFSANWLLIFPFIGLVALCGLLIYYGIHFVASFGISYKSKKYYYPSISIIIASKNEKPLLARTLKSIMNTEYPKDKIQIITVTSGSTDSSTEFCEKFAKENKNIDMIVLSKSLSKKGKPAALNYGFEFVKNDICIFYDSGNVITSKTLAELVEPFQYGNHKVTIGPMIIENWNQNKWTRAAALTYVFSAGGNMYFHVKNKLGSSAYLFGRNFAIKTKLLKDLGGFNENSLTEDLYLTVLLNLEGEKILFVPKARAYDLTPNNWNAIKKQRTRWVGGYVGDAPDLTKLKKGNKNGQSIIISRNLSMLLLHHLDVCLLVITGFVVFYALIGFYYMFAWTLSLFIFVFGYLFNGIRKYGDKHYSLFLWAPVSSRITLFMFSLQFTLPAAPDISWEKTPMILEKSQEEIESIISATIN